MNLPVFSYWKHLERSQKAVRQSGIGTDFFVNNTGISVTRGLVSHHGFYNGGCAQIVTGQPRTPRYLVLEPSK